MARSDEFASVTLDVEAGARPVIAEPEEDTPFRILILGDFSGRPDEQRSAARWKPVLVDRDNFDQVMASMNVELHLGPAGETGPTLRFNELDDFRPESLYARLGIFSELRRMRGRLEDGSSRTEAIEEVRRWAGLAAAPPARPEAPRPAASSEPVNLSSLTGSLLDDVLEASQAATPAERPASSDPLQRFIQQSLAQHLTPKQNPMVPELIARLDDATGELMRSILHSRRFQSLESAWRALFLLIRRLETGTQLKVYILDITRRQLAAELQAGAAS